jgi:hypothetical protein
MHRQSIRIPRVCQHCLAPFEGLPSEVRRGGALFCSRACRSAAGTHDLAERFWSKVAKSEACWLWTAATDRNGYGILMMRRDGKKRPYAAHRIAWELTHGPIPDDDHGKPLRVLHNCPDGDNTLCVRPSHLFLGTQGDNVRDMIAKGRGLVGTHNGHARLTPALVAEIRRRYIPHQFGYIRLAHEYGVSERTIRDIIARRLWREVA